MTCCCPFPRKRLNVYGGEYPELWFALVWKTLWKCKILLLHPSLTYYSFCRARLICTENQHKAPCISQILSELNWPVAVQGLQKGIYVSFTSTKPHLSSAKTDLICWAEFHSLTTSPPHPISTVPHTTKIEENSNYQPKRSYSGLVFVFFLMW